jgi:hypothetical protein
MICHPFEHGKGFLLWGIGIISYISKDLDWQIAHIANLKLVWIGFA